MFSITIDAVLKTDYYTKKHFIGVFARDEIPHSIPYPCCFVINTENHAKDGEH